jgi:FKBP12-rapamycin complex-associated protein
LLKVIPALISAIRRSTPAYQGPWLTKLGTLISIVKFHIRNFLDPILSLVLEYWDHPQLQTVVIQLVEVVARAIEGEFKAFLPRILQEVLRTFDGDLSDPRRHEVLVEILHALSAFGLSVEEYNHLILPAILKLFDRADVSQKVRETSVITIGTLARKVNFSDHASQIIHPLARVLSANSPSNPDSQHMTLLAMNTLCSMVVQLGSDYAIFIPMISKVCLLSSHPKSELKLTFDSFLLDRSCTPDGSNTATTISSSSRSSSEIVYLKTLARWTSEHPLSVACLSLESSSVDRSCLSRRESNETPKIATPAPAAVNQQSLKQVWDTSMVASQEEWRDWTKRLGLDLLRESPSVALRACQELAQEHNALNEALFNVAFISCWTTLYEPYQVRFGSIVVFRSFVDSADLQRLSSRFSRRILSPRSQTPSRPTPLDPRRSTSCSICASLPNTTTSRCRSTRRCSART